MGELQEKKDWIVDGGLYVVLTAIVVFFGSWTAFENIRVPNLVSRKELAEEQVKIHEKTITELRDKSDRQESENSKLKLENERYKRTQEKSKTQPDTPEEEARQEEQITSLRDKIAELEKQLSEKQKDAPQNDTPIVDNRFQVENERLRADNEKLTTELAEREAESSKLNRASIKTSIIPASHFPDGRSGTPHGQEPLDKAKIVGDEVQLFRSTRKGSYRVYAKLSTLARISGLDPEDHRVQKLGIVYSSKGHNQEVSLNFYISASRAENRNSRLTADMRDVVAEDTIWFDVHRFDPEERLMIDVSGRAGGDSANEIAATWKGVVLEAVPTN